MSRRIQIAIGGVLAVFLLWLFLRDSDIGNVVAELKRADYRWVLAATMLTLLSAVHRAWRWHYLLLPVKSISLGPLTATMFMGWAFNTLLPGRLGEVARPVLLGRRERISKTAAFATIVLERLFDLMCVLLILVAYLLFFPPPPAGIVDDGRAIIAGMRLSGLIALGGLVVAVVFLVASQLMPRRTDAFLVRIAGWAPGKVNDQLLAIGRSFLTGFAGIKDPKLIATIAVHSLLIWLNILVTYYILFFAFDIDLPYYAVMPLVVAVVIGVMVPTPAAVGAFHAAALVALGTLWGVPNDQAVTYAIVCHAMAFGPITVIGIALLGREGLSVLHFEGL
jgi:uncharacterized protein (TIRG00374 family)